MIIKFNWYEVLDNFIIRNNNGYRANIIYNYLNNLNTGFANANRNLIRRLTGNIKKNISESKYGDRN